MNQLTVAAAQIECRPGDLAFNLARHFDAIARAKDAGVDLLVFPELSLADYVSTPDLARVAIGPGHEVLGAVAQAAGELVAFVGFVERSPRGHHIATAMVADGRLVHVHRKVNLATYGNLVEGRHYIPGGAIDLTDALGWRASILICADAWNPALPWLAALKGAELLILPVASALGAVEGEFDNPSGWEWTLRQIAVTYALPTVMANHCGTRGNLRFWGGSRVLDPYGRELARLGNEPGLAIARIERDAMTVARERLPTMRDSAPRFVASQLAGHLEATGHGEPSEMPARP